MLRAKYRKILWLLLAVQLIPATSSGVRLLCQSLWLYRVLSWLPMGSRLYRHLGQCVPAAWLLGIVLTGAWQLLSYHNFRRKALRGMKPIDEGWIRTAAAYAEAESGCRVMLPLYRSNSVDTPMVLGFTSRVLLIPEQEYSFSELYMIFLHECTHVKKRDIWYKLLFTIGACVLWFQPLMYLLRRAAYRDVEVACDQSVVRGRSEAERLAYGQMLLNSIRKGRSRELPYSAYFYNSKSVMRARLAVVRNEEERAEYLGALVCLLAAVETFALLLTVGARAGQEIQSHYEPEVIENIYEGYELPESFTAEAVGAMTGAAVPAAPGTDVAAEAEGPWMLEAEGDYETAASEISSGLLARYMFYYTDQERGSRYASGDGTSAGLEIRNAELLLGGEEDFVYAVRFRELPLNEEERAVYESLPGMRYAYDNGYNYAYFDWALHIRKAGENVYELVGVAELDEVRQACAEAGLETEDLSLVELDPWALASCRARTTNGTPEVTWDNGLSWQELPIDTERLFDRGDQMDGALTSIQDKSYVVTEEMTAFAYGGSERTPVTVTYTTDQGVTWNTSVLTYEYTSVRRLFLSFPDAENGFLVLTVDRTMWQEGSILFRTADGGRTWKEIGAAGPGPEEGHSLTTGAAFITPEIGFLSIRDSQTPNLYRTADGGLSWERVTLPDTLPDAGFTMAYPPETDGDTLLLYLGMEEYTELSGYKARYRSEDLGETWVYDGIVVRR